MLPVSAFLRVIPVNESQLSLRSSGQNSMTTRPELIADRAIGRACANGHAGTARSALALGIGVQRDSRPIALNVNVNTTGCTCGHVYVFARMAPSCRMIDRCVPDTRTYMRAACVRITGSLRTMLQRDACSVRQTCRPIHDVPHARRRSRCTCTCHSDVTIV